MLRNFVLFLVFAFISFAAVDTVSAQDDVDLGTLQYGPVVSGELQGTWSPVAGSRTAMRNVLSEEKAFANYPESERVVLSSALDVEWMKFYDYNARKVGTTSRTCKQRDRKGECVRYEEIIIKAGTVVRFNPNDRTRGIVEGCLNEFKIPEPIMVPNKTIINKTVAVKEPEVCKNKPFLTLEEADKRGYDIDEDGRCTKESKPVAVEPLKCANKPYLTLEEADKRGYDIDEDNRCEKPVAPAVVAEVKKCPDDYKLDENSGMCVKKGMGLGKKILIVGGIAAAVITTAVVVKKNSHKCTSACNHNPPTSADKTQTPRITNPNTGNTTQRGGIAGVTPPSQTGTVATRATIGNSTPPINNTGGGGGTRGGSSFTAQGSGSRISTAPAQAGGRKVTGKVM